VPGRMAECLPISCLSDDIPAYIIKFFPRHSRSCSLDPGTFGSMDDVVDLLRLVRGFTDSKCSGKIGVEAIVDTAEIQRHQFSLPDLFRAGTPMRKSTTRS